MFVLPKMEPVLPVPKAFVFVFVPKAFPVFVEPKRLLEGVVVLPNPVVAGFWPNNPPVLLLLPKAFAAGCCPKPVVAVLFDPNRFEPVVVPEVEPKAVELLGVVPKPPKLVEVPNAPAC